MRVIKPCVYMIECPVIQNEKKHITVTFKEDSEEQDLVEASFVLGKKATILKTLATTHQH